MNALLFTDLLLRSLAIGALAAACVWLCPESWRVRVRRLVPVVAFTGLLVLTLGLVRPLPQFEIAAPASISKLGELPAWNPGAWVSAAWLAGVALCLARLTIGALAIRSLLKKTAPLPGRAWKHALADCMRAVGVRGNVGLRVAGPGFVPSATGLFRRTILLPDEARGWTAGERRIVLLHELGHFRRGDLWTHALGRLACALHWFNPFAWMLHRQLTVEREFACDELVIERGAARGDYATLLWQMASAMRRRPSPAAAFLAMASPRTGTLEERVRRILAPARKAGRLLRIADGMLCATLAALLIFCTACKPVHRTLSHLGSPWDTAELEARLTADPFPGNR